MDKITNACEVSGPAAIGTNDTNSNYSSEK